MADKKIVDTLIGVFVGAILAAAMIPIALQQLAGAVLTNVTAADVTNQSIDVPAAQIALYGVIAIAVIVVVVVLFFKLI